MSTDNRGFVDQLGAFLALLTRFSEVLGTAIETRTEKLIAFERSCRIFSF